MLNYIWTMCCLIYIQILLLLPVWEQLWIMCYILLDRCAHYELSLPDGNIIFFYASPLTWLQNKLASSSQPKNMLAMCVVLLLLNKSVMKLQLFHNPYNSMLGKVEYKLKQIQGGRTSRVEIGSIGQLMNISGDNIQGQLKRTLTLQTFLCCQDVKDMFIAGIFQQGLHCQVIQILQQSLMQDTVSREQQEYLRNCPPCMLKIVVSTA